MISLIENQSRNRKRSTTSDQKRWLFYRIKRHIVRQKEKTKKSSQHNIVEEKSVEIDNNDNDNSANIVVYWHIIDIDDDVDSSYYKRWR